MALSEGGDAPVEKRLAEVAFRVNDMDAMVAFYRDIIQLTVLRQEPKMSFLKISEGFEGHTAVLALFDRNLPVQPGGSTDHIAFSIALKDFEPEKKRLEALGYNLEFDAHNWQQWRSMYFQDPENNRVEFVSYDPSLPKNFDS